MGSFLYRRAKPSYRPHLLLLEDRLPLGEGVLGVLMGASLLSTNAALSATVQPSAADLGRLTPHWSATQGLTLLTRPAEGTFAGTLDAERDLAPEWDNLKTAFVPSARRQLSPQREQEREPPLLALPAREEGAASSAAVSAPVLAAAAPHTESDLLALLVGIQADAAPTVSSGTPAQATQVKESFGKLPLYFEENIGQTDAQVHFFTRGPGYSLFLTATEAVMVLQPEPHPLTSAAVVRMQLIGANATPTVTGRGELPGKVNYFLGNDPAQWRTNVATFARVQYEQVYPGIDLVYYGNQQQLEYDFVVSPGADPSAIGLSIQGAERIQVDDRGDLVIQASGHEVRQQRPFVYQESGGARQEVASRFVLEGQRVYFQVEAHDTSRPLVIDPVLSYSTYLGGSEFDISEGLAVDGEGNVYVSGSTISPDFPTANAFQPKRSGDHDTFLSKLSADGSQLIYSTYLGGSGLEEGGGVAVNAAGEAYVTGATDSSDFPVTAGAYQETFGGEFDVFVARLSADGSALLAATYLGGERVDGGTEVVVDSNGDAYVTGATDSFQFPVSPKAFQPTYGGKSQDAFIAKLSADGGFLLYSSFLGGSGNDTAPDLAVDADGFAYVGGYTTSDDFPVTPDSFQPIFQGNSDAFIAKVNLDGTGLVYSTFLGGTDYEDVIAIALDEAGNAYVTGPTGSLDFPTVNPYQSELNGESDFFIAKLNAAGSELAYATYLGGSEPDGGGAIAVDASGNAYVAGATYSFDFPTVEPLQEVSGGRLDGVVVVLDPTGSTLLFSTFLGGKDDDDGRALALAPDGAILVTGCAASTDFPIVNALQPQQAGLTDAWVAKILLS